ncbi:hypothetical protein Purlil1_13297 [Purpureocillium lilacinum]|uniref:AP2/ERF domain-containing protein n=1 Tax=Purpureocillium lilacinum TaxID=33203 RepID=A0ABR0BEH7_PURLI|nr:hypothetical protein Purlil1_13297 [Purpureocillium lilacinum]
MCLDPPAATKAKHLIVNISDESERESFLDEFQRSTAVRGENYQLLNEDRHGSRLVPLPGAQFGDPFPGVHRDIHDWQTLRRQRLVQTTHSGGASAAPKTEYGVYQDQRCRLWIDGSWQRAYGRFGKNNRNERVESAMSAYRDAKIQFTHLPSA